MGKSADDSLAFPNQAGYGDPNVSIVLNQPKAPTTSQNILPITTYCLPSSGNSSGNGQTSPSHTTVTPPGMVSTVVAGSHLPSAKSVLPPTTYANFKAGLATNPLAHLPSSTSEGPCAVEYLGFFAPVYDELSPYYLCFHIDGFFDS